MSWIESHTTLKEHPKLFALMDRLKIGRAAAIGNLHLLWWWACDYASDGTLNKYSEAQIARAADWSGNPGAFVKALLDSGFLERKAGKLSIHDWGEFRLHYDALIARIDGKKAQVRDRVKAFRDRQRSGNAPVTQCNAPVTQCNADTIPNLPNIPNLTDITNLGNGKRVPLGDKLMNMTMPFGECKGWLIRNMDPEKCRWLLGKWNGKDALTPDLREALQARVDLKDSEKSPAQLKRDRRP